MDKYDKLLRIEDISLDLIVQYNSFWKRIKTKSIDWEVQLFRGGERVDISHYIPKDGKSESFKGFRESDERIYSFVERFRNRNDDENCKLALREINKAYHTCISGEKLHAYECEKDIIRILKDQEHATINGFINKCCEFVENYRPYSFTTKVFSFFFYDKKWESYPNRRGYPILDSFVVGLLKHFLNLPSTSKWGNYYIFKRDYDRFIDAVLRNSNLPIDTKITYKDVDVFLWTYGKVVNCSTKGNPVLKQANPTFIPIDEE